jgi:hypothetical protein
MHPNFKFYEGVAALIARSAIAFKILKRPNPLTPFPARRGAGGEINPAQSRYKFILIFVDE